MKKLFLSLFLSIVLFSWANAEYKIYLSQQDFENDKWSICEAATDWCNIYTLKNWKVTSWTEKFCMDHTPEWVCTKYKEWTYTTMSILNSSWEWEFCWWIAWIQCSSWLECNLDWNYPDAGWTCEKIDKFKNLSQNDINFYNTIRKRLDVKYINMVEKTVNRYNEISDWLSDSKKSILKSNLLKKIDDYLFEITMSVPQDAAMPEKLNKVYLTLNLLKLEIEIQ